MSFEFERFEHKGLTIRIMNDEDPMDPEEGDLPIYLVHFHRSFNRCPDGLPFSDPAGCEWLLFGPQDGDGFGDKAEWKEEREGWRVFLVDAYIHGGVRLALRGSPEAGRFPDRQWDVSCCGAVLIKDDGEWDPIGEKLADEQAREMAEGHIKAWNTYLNGEVCGYTVERDVQCDSCGHVESEILESCWGFYDLEDCKREAKAAADAP